MLEQGRTEIINMALLYMGQDTIIDPKSETKNAKLCAAVYNAILAEALSRYPWSFATLAVQLQRRAEAPRDTRFQHQYQLPADVGRIREVIVTGSGPLRDWDLANSLPQAMYIVQGDKLLCDTGPLQMLYTRARAEPFEMPPLFMDWFAALIAARLYFKITGSRDGSQAMEKAALEKELAARHADSVGTSNLPENRPDLLLRARRY